MFTGVKYYYCFMIQQTISLSIVFMKILHMAQARVIRKQSKPYVTHEHLSEEVTRTICAS